MTHLDFEKLTGLKVDPREYKMAEELYCCNNYPMVDFCKKFMQMNHKEFLATLAHMADLKDCYIAAARKEKDFYLDVIEKIAVMVRQDHTEDVAQYLREVFGKEKMIKMLWKHGVRPSDEDIDYLMSNCEL